MKLLPVVKHLEPGLHLVSASTVLGTQPSRRRGFWLRTATQTDRTGQRPDAQKTPKPCDGERLSPRHAVPWKVGVCTGKVKGNPSLTARES